MTITGGGEFYQMRAFLRPHYARKPIRDTGLRSRENAPKKTLGLASKESEGHGPKSTSSVQGLEEAVWIGWGGYGLQRCWAGRFRIEELGDRPTADDCCWLPPFLVQWSSQVRKGWCAFKFRLESRVFSPWRWGIPSVCVCHVVIWVHSVLAQSCSEHLTDQKQKLWKLQPDT